MMAQAVTPADWSGVVRWAEDLGVSHLGLANRIAGGSPGEQIEMCRQFVEEKREWWGRLRGSR
jgi:hypothetical protein